MKPIAQTFSVVDSTGNIDAIFLTKIDLYFRTKSDIFGVEVQIRTTENGIPGTSILPFASKVLDSALVNISSDGSVATTFTFDTPVIIPTNNQYAIAVVPVAGNPDYTICTAVVGATDSVTGALIHVNNQLGTLFISTNDYEFSALQNETLKYNLYTANFTSTTGYAAYRNADTDFFLYKTQIGNFILGEQIVLANNNLSLASITLASTITPWTNGDLVWQPNTASSNTTATAIGTVYYSNSSVVLLNNVTGQFTTTGGGLKNYTASATTVNPTATYTNTSIGTASNTAPNTTITVPNANSSLTTDFAVGNFIYVGANTRSIIQVTQIQSVDVTNRRLTVFPGIKFTDGNAIIGRVRSDANLCGYLSGKSGILVVDGVTANASSNFANSAGNLIIGRSSGASANSLGLLNPYYDSITTQFTSANPKMTGQGWGFKGISNTKTVDSNYYTLSSGTPYEFIDEQRMLMSRSIEYANSIGGIPGTSSLYVKTDLSTSNASVSPYVDTIQNIATLTHNVIRPFSETAGYYITIANSSGTFNTGDTIWQSNSTANTSAKVLYANNTSLTVSGLTSSNASIYPTFNANGTSIVTDSNNSVLANVSAVACYNEALPNMIGNATRYISKNVYLASGQDADDLVCYLGAYRPPGTNIQVFTKGVAAIDNEDLSVKSWSYMTETSSPALLSSLVDRNDIVELSYDLPTSVQLYAANGSGNNTSTILNVPATGSTSGIKPGSFLYIADTSGTTTSFNVRQVMSIANATSVLLSSNLSFTSSNVGIGTIPGLLSKTGMFKNSLNNGQVRYCTATDSVYDTVINFAVKIVLSADSSQVVPRLTDMRTLALQV